MAAFRGVVVGSIPHIVDYVAHVVVVTQKPAVSLIIVGVVFTAAIWLGALSQTSVYYTRG